MPKKSAIRLSAFAREVELHAENYRVNPLALTSATSSAHEQKAGHGTSEIQQKTRESGEIGQKTEEINPGDSPDRSPYKTQRKLTNLAGFTYTYASPHEGGPEARERRNCPIGDPSNSPSTNLRLAAISHPFVNLPHGQRSLNRRIGKSKQASSTVAEGTIRFNNFTDEQENLTEAEKPNRIDNSSQRIGLHVGEILSTAITLHAPRLLQINPTQTERSNRPPDPISKAGLNMGGNRLFRLSTPGFSPNTSDPGIGPFSTETRSIPPAITPISENSLPPAYTSNCPHRSGYVDVTTKTKKPNSVSNFSLEVGLSERET
ncbi:hypothetical protein R1flu_007978 [Riccia fluitans]|uniref:Uncharacterized protein n=1 Tax=Riccia fluitans TaxID=41844 RepID=A0ABD1YAL3_9MARC